MPSTIAPMLALKPVINIAPVPRNLKRVTGLRALKRRLAPLQQCRCRRPLGGTGHGTPEERP